MNFHSDLWINKKIQEHYEDAIRASENREVIGVFLHGSQNYGLDFETSDVDTICLVMPSRRDIVCCSHPCSFEHKRENGEHIVFWDIRHFLNLIEKGGFNQLEILYTNYFILNPQFNKFWDNIVKRRNHLRYINTDKTANSFYGMICRCVAEIQNHPEEEKRYKKEYMRVHFFYCALLKYLNLADFEDVLHPSCSDKIKKYKTTNISYDEIIKEVNLIKEASKSTKKLFYDCHHGNKASEVSLNAINDIRNSLFNIMNANGINNETTSYTLALVVDCAHCNKQFVAKIPFSVFAANPSVVYSNYCKDCCKFDKSTEIEPNYVLYEKRNRIIISESNDVNDLKRIVISLESDDEKNGCFSQNQYEICDKTGNIIR